MKSCPPAVGGSALGDGGEESLSDQHSEHGDQHYTSPHIKWDEYFSHRLGIKRDVEKGSYWPQHHLFCPHLCLERLNYRADRVAADDLGTEQSRRQKQKMREEMLKQGVELEKSKSEERDWQG